MNLKFHDLLSNCSTTVQITDISICSNQHKKHECANSFQILFLWKSLESTRKVKCYVTWFPELCRISNQEFFYTMKNLWLNIMLSPLLKWRLWWLHNGNDVIISTRYHHNFRCRIYVGKLHSYINKVIITCI